MRNLREGIHGEKILSAELKDTRHATPACLLRFRFINSNENVRFLAHADLAPYTLDHVTVSEGVQSQVVVAQIIECVSIVLLSVMLDQLIAKQLRQALERPAVLERSDAADELHGNDVVILHPLESGRKAASHISALLSARMHRETAKYNFLIQYLQFAASAQGFSRTPQMQRFLLT